ncbi:MAG TPA: phosphotransferase [Rhodanobacteraceae bacterium]|nr:phosphotransferase [Rhodanobacteraceae bacterium]
MNDLASPPVTDRAAERLAFARTALGDAITLERASEDASFRSYWRAGGGARSAIVMDAPPAETEKFDAWLDVNARLRAAGLHAPEVLAADRARGLMLLEDLGTRTYLPELDDSTVDALYGDALATLVTMQVRVDARGLPPYDEPRLMTELELMPTWFLQKHLGIGIECDEWDVIEAAFRLLINSALMQPRAYLHRDYHSRNLMIVPENGPGIIDIQDALLGPLTYDLVSLLRDCYIVWDEVRVRTWAESHRIALREADLLDERVDAALWQRWFDLMGLQRHIKVLGLFCRLWYRDGKRGYLNDLPRVWNYVRSVGQQHPELADFVALIERKISDRDLTQAAP